jgi:hypothetical protein
MGLEGKTVLDSLPKWRASQQSSVDGVANTNPQAPEIPAVPRMRSVIEIL